MVSSHLTPPPRIPTLDETPTEQNSDHEPETPIVNKSVYELFCDKFEDSIVNVLTPLIYVGVVVLVLYFGIAEFFKWVIKKNGYNAGNVHAAYAHAT